MKTLFSFDVEFLAGLSLFGIVGVFLFVIVIIPKLKVFEGLINFSVFGSFQELFFSFNLMKFTPDIFSNIPNVFQENVLLSGILFTICKVTFLKIIETI